MIYSKNLEGDSLIFSSLVNLQDHGAMIHFGWAIPNMSLPIHPWPGKPPIPHLHVSASLWKEVNWMGIIMM